MSTNKLRLPQAISLVVGNMVGVGILILPGTLAEFGSVSLFGWLLAAFGALFLAFSFSYLNQIYPLASGGPYIYVKKTFGNFWGFQMAWIYWMSTWVSNITIVLGCLIYLYYFDERVAIPWVSFVLSMIILWLFTFLNTRSIRFAGNVQFILSIIKIIPIILVALIGVFYVDFSNIYPFTFGENTFFTSLTESAMVAFFAFIGLESATIVSEGIESPKKTITQATIIGTIIVTIIYIFVTYVVIGVLSIDNLLDPVIGLSKPPFVAVAEKVFGVYMAKIIGLLIVIACLGTLHGWVLLQGQMPYAAAKDALMPESFVQSKNGVPIFGLIFSSILSSIFMLLIVNLSLNDQMTLIIKLTVFSTLIPFMATGLSGMVVFARDRKYQSIRKFLICGLGFFFTLWVLFPEGEKICRDFKQCYDSSSFKPIYTNYGIWLILSGIPFYFICLYFRKKRV